MTRATPPPFPPPSRRAPADAPPAEPPHAPRGESHDGTNRRLVVGAAVVAAVAIVVLAVLALVGSDDGTPEASPPSSELPAPDDTPPDDGSVTGAGWEVVLDGAVSAQPLLAAGQVVVGTESGAVVAFDRRDGAVRWRADVAPGVPVRVALVEDRAVFAAGVTLGAISLADGETTWTVTTPGEITALEPEGSDVVVGGRGFVALHDAETGAAAWTTPLEAPPDATGEPQIVLQIDATADLFVVGSLPFDERDVAAWALDRADGTVRWALTGFPLATSHAVTADGAQVLVSWVDGVTAVDTASGATVWTQPTPANGWFTGTVDDVVLVLDREGGTALDPTTGAARWSVDGASLLAVDGTVVSAGPDGLAGRDPSTGAVRWERAGTVTQVAVHDDAVVAVLDGSLLLVVAADDGEVRTEVTWEIGTSELFVADGAGALAATGDAEATLRFRSYAG